MSDFKQFGNPIGKGTAYTIELLTPYERKLGVIPAVLNYQYRNKVMGLNEIEFDIPAYFTIEQRDVAHPFYNIVDNGMIIQIHISGQKEPLQYIVDTVNESTEKSTEAQKHIHAFSKEYFLSRKKFLGMELAGRILYYTPDLPERYRVDGDGLPRAVLNDIFEKYGITVSHIDESLTRKAREVSIGSTNIYQFLAHLEEVFGCIFKFNGDATKVEIYDSANFGRDTGVTISERNIINTFSENTRYEDMVTRLYVYGADEISIASVNPTGLPYIENLSYFFKENYLPDYLINLYNEFMELPKHSTELSSLVAQRNDLLGKITEAEFYLEVVRDELRQASHWAEALDLRAKNDVDYIGSDPKYEDGTAWSALQNAADVRAFIQAVKTNTTITDRSFTNKKTTFVSLLELSRSVDQELQELFKNDLDTLQARGGEAGWLAEIDRLKQEYATVTQTMGSLQKNNDFNQYMAEHLSVEQFKESKKALDAVTIEGEYINSDLDSSMLNELLEEGKKELDKLCFPKIQFTVDALDFSQLFDTQDLWNYLLLGDIIYVKTDTGFNYPVHFIGIEHSPDTASLNLQFSSSAALTDSTVFLADLIANATRTSGILSLNKDSWNKAAEQASVIRQQLKEGFDLAQQQLAGASKQVPILDERGFWLYALDSNENPKPEQIRAINNVIALTKDGWETIEVAITPEGINANAIVVGTLSADRVRLGRFESVDKNTYWDLETNEIKIGDTFFFSPETGLEIDFQPPAKHKNLISTAEFFTEYSVSMPENARHRFETNATTGELRLIAPREAGTYDFYLAIDSAALTQNFTLLRRNLGIIGESMPYVTFALASSNYDAYSNPITMTDGQRVYTIVPTVGVASLPLSFLQISLTKDSTASETGIVIPPETLALVKEWVPDLTWQDTIISGVSSSTVINNERIGLTIQNNIENKLAALNITEEGITQRVSSSTKEYFDLNKELFKGDTGPKGQDGANGGNFTWNMIRGTSDNCNILNFTNADYYKQFFYPDVIWEVGQSYTFSLLIERLSDDNSPINVHVGSGATAYQLDIIEAQINGVDTTKRVVINFTIEEKHLAKGDKFAFRVRNERVPMELCIKEVKLEKGINFNPTWSPHETEIQGQDGKEGAPGKPGENGLTPYFHVAYANSADGTLDFDIEDSTNRAYLGQYTDFKKEDSTKPGDYTWTLIKGTDGGNFTWNMIKGTKDLTIGGLTYEPGSRKEYQAPKIDTDYNNLTLPADITISFDIEQNTGKSFDILVYNTNLPGPHMFDSKTLTIPNGKSRQFVHTVLKTRPNPTKTENYIEFYSVYGTNNWYKITNLKIELGHTNNPIWSPHESEIKGEEGVGIKHIEPLYAYSDTPNPNFAANEKAYNSVDLFDKTKLTSLPMHPVNTTLPLLELALPPNTQYTLSTDIPKSADSVQFDLFFDLHDMTVNSGSNGVAINAPRTITSDETGRVWITFRNQALVDKVVSGENWVKLEEGSEATPRVEDVGQEILWTSYGVGENKVQKTSAQFWNDANAGFAQGRASAEIVNEREVKTTVTALTADGNVAIYYRLMSPEMQQANLGKTLKTTFQYKSNVVGANCIVNEIGGSYTHVLNITNDYQEATNTGLQARLNNAFFPIYHYVSHNNTGYKVGDWVMIKDIKVEEPFYLNSEKTQTVKTPYTISPTDHEARKTDYLWQRQMIIFTDGRVELTEPSPVYLAKDGAPGKDGVGITSTTIEYAVNQSGTIHPTTGWSGTVPKTNPGDYIWTKITWNYTDDTSEDAYSVGRIGVDGPDGDDGLPGAPGVGIKMTTITYTKSNSGTVIPPSTATWSPTPPAGNPGEFIWTRTVWTYTDNTTEAGYSVGKIGNTGPQGPQGIQGPQGVQGANGKDGIPGVDGKPGVGISKTVIDYAGSTSGTIAPTTGYTTTVPTVAPGNFLWTRTTWTYTDATTETSYSVGLIGKNGNTGADGNPGKDGVGIDKTLIEYAKNTSGTVKPTTGWSTTIPSTVPGDFLWTRTTWIYTDTTSEQGYTVGKIGNTGPKGADGVDAKLISLSASEQVFKNNTPATITVTGLAQNTSITSWTYSSNSGAFTTTLPAGVTRSGNTVTITQSTMTANTLTIKASDGTYSDTVSIAKLADGISGTDGFTVLLTNESQTFPANSSGTVTSYAGGYSDVVVYYGGTPLTCTTTGTAAPTVNKTYTVTATTASAGTVTLTPSLVSSNYRVTPSALTTDNAIRVLTIVARVNNTNYTFKKTLTYAKSKSGADGADGTSSYLWIRYYSGDLHPWDEEDYSKFTMFPTESTKWIGTTTFRYEDTYAEGNINIEELSWTKFVGSDGRDGIDGLNGVDLSMARMIYNDPTFKKGNNEISPYTRGVTPTLALVTDSTSPYIEEGARVYRVTSTSGTTTSCGGIYQDTDSRPNAIFVHKLVAKVPEGFELMYASDDTGVPSQVFWMSDNKGTGRYEEYAYMHKCGQTGSFSTLGYVYAKPLPATPPPTSTNPLVWYIAYATMFDLTADGMYQEFETYREQTDTKILEQIQRTTYVNEDGSEVPLATKVSETVKELEKFSVKYESVGGANLIKGGKYPTDWKPYDGAVITETRNQLVGEWETSNAVRVQASSGNQTSTFKSYYVMWNTPKLEYKDKYITMTMKIKNNGAYALTCKTNTVLAGANEVQVPPNTAMLVAITGLYRATGQLQFHVNSASNITIQDFYAYEAMVEEGQLAHEWSQHKDEVLTGVTEITAEGLSVKGDGVEVESWMKKDGFYVYDKASGQSVMEATSDGGKFDVIYSNDIISDTIVKKINRNFDIYVQGNATGDGSGRDTNNRANSITEALEHTLGGAKYLNEGVTINIHVYGTVNETAFIAGFIGQGDINVFGYSGAKITGRMVLSSCTVHVMISNLTFVLDQAESANNNACILGHKMSRMIVEGCVFDGPEVGNGSGILTTGGTNLSVGNSAFYEFKYCVNADTLSNVTLYNIRGNDVNALALATSGARVVSTGYRPTQTYNNALQNNNAWTLGGTDTATTGTKPVIPTPVFKTVSKTFYPRSIGTRNNGSSYVWNTSEWRQGTWSGNGVHVIGFAEFGSAIRDWLNGGGGFAGTVTAKIEATRTGSGYGSVGMMIASPSATNTPAVARFAKTSANLASGIVENMKTASSFRIQSNTSSTSNYAGFKDIKITVTCQKKI